MSFIVSLLNALVAIPKIAGYVEAFASWVATWYVNRLKQEQLTKIIDAASLAARAETQEERYVAAEAWRTALSAPRIIN